MSLFKIYEYEVLVLTKFFSEDNEPLLYRNRRVKLKVHLVMCWKQSFTCWAILYCAVRWFFVGPHYNWRLSCLLQRWTVETFCEYISKMYRLEIKMKWFEAQDPLEMGLSVSFLVESSIILIQRNNCALDLLPYDCFKCWSYITMLLRKEN